ncbi:MAG: 3-deoxy-7-phosphoheptulonate synthase [Ignavibacteriales bacterium CG12_big_fil_rev_8_21_14_0_65_30_8]|nr:MAG: 3-deoxy-7-phosphoheptulonate synthase [Ignavibacteriales bacterium CG12_big_fil_rev_8_21_14_0_65_30_8]
MEDLKNTKIWKRNKNHNTIVKCNDVNFGEGFFTVIAGPCAIENSEMALKTAKEVEKLGASVFRSSLFKPRTSPYSFQGIGKEGVNILAEIRSQTNLLLESEVLSEEHLDILIDHIDIIRIGSRNMDNYELLKIVGKINKPVILKRGMSSTLKEFLFAAEYIIEAGNEQIILCERGIRSFDNYTRNTLDILAIPSLKELTHLPVIVDPSHSTGKRSLVPSASKAAIAAGADGLMIEVHPDPTKALSDGEQSIDFFTFEKLMKEIKKLLEIFDKSTIFKNELSN